MNHSEMVKNQKRLIIDVKHDDINWGVIGVSKLLSMVSNSTLEQANDALAALNCAGDLHDAIMDLKIAVKTLEDGPRCCGHEWRNKTGRLYMHHSLRSDCPLHGKAHDGADRGLRSYVNQEDEEMALQAAADFQEWKRKKSEFRKVQGELDTLTRRLKQLSNGQWW